MRSMQQRSQKNASRKKDGIELLGGILDPDLPLSKQLEQSFDTIKSHSQSIKVIYNELPFKQSFIEVYLYISSSAQN